MFAGGGGWEKLWYLKKTIKHFLYLEPFEEQKFILRIF